jgi:hypothetical protein
MVELGQLAVFIYKDLSTVKEGIGTEGEKCLLSVRYFIRLSAFKLKHLL